MPGSHINSGSSARTPIAYAPIGGMPYIQYLGLDGRQEENRHVLVEQAPIPEAKSYIPHPPIHIPYKHPMHISLLRTVYDMEI